MRCFSCEDSNSTPLLFESDLIWFSWPPVAFGTFHGGFSKLDIVQSDVERVFSSCFHLSFWFIQQWSASIIWGYSEGYTW